MEQKVLRERENRCVQEQPPGCTAACPVHVDARGIVAAIRKEDYKSGAQLFYKMIPFPRIISQICDQLCQQQCTRKEIDESIFMNCLEKICVDKSPELALKLIPIQLKSQKVAIVGGGLSGLTAAVELGKKGYQIVVFEGTDRLGGGIWVFSEGKLPRQNIIDDFSLLTKLPIEINVKTIVGNQRDSNRSFANIIESFDAVYLAIGSTDLTVLNLDLELDGKGNIEIDPITKITSNPKVFAGGSLTLGPNHKSPITSISHGKLAANSIDRLLQNASLTARRENEGSFKSLLYTNIDGIEPQKGIFSVSPDAEYTTEEILQEANRCLLCECLECVKVCEYLAHFHAYPKRYVREVYNNLSIVMGVRHANKMINACNLCGLCEEVCPGKLNMGEICREARHVMVEKGKMPPSVHDFALRDMQFSTSEESVLAKHQPGFSSSCTVFFPGCQLSASSPQHVKKMYQFLCEKITGGVGLMLGCCGVPADWAGKEQLFQETLENIKDHWRMLGTPKVITGCPTCYSIFKRFFPEMVVESMWTLLEKIGLPSETHEKLPPLTLAVHDTCTTRHETELQQSIRTILHQLGHHVEELKNSHEMTECCGYGGLMLFANKDIAHKMIQKRIHESDHDYLTYCAMCRDNFTNQGKRTYHLLELIFNIEGQDLAGQKGPGYSDRQENRARLKATLLKELWGESMNKEDDMMLMISEHVKQLMEEGMILKSDVAQVIKYAESTGNKLKNIEKNTYTAYFKPVSVTYWVEYSLQENGFVVHNAYSHRLEIKG
ncbi:pyridine nucleotide-disulfide oxidoreductase/dicluster-binding protein [Pelosinus sp. sgz500959]|uniref:pyridine nucleotide-disulfide oxidoreductase/dicluster-binding protein n=1 Tax=Pelosinus sp. sgz500959 TaxID=3242472 RepID=UPI003670F73D